MKPSFVILSGSLPEIDAFQPQYHESREDHVERRSPGEVPSAWLAPAARVVFS
jgi:hypothetical protein